ncbi:murein biosynthesis integral membrane protein MurJ [Shouchella lehensis]|uniref:murein biosynthesis integral membrane protein MurJ n=1 Tax=Shouchella lehensis TaxID=300825 RepID=UPI00141981D9|nr:murein biosynthesis integral membrane protein MurJ [Shouchella lehensis]MBG9785024.1 hypothetical protein [Shouchella lehensis]
MKILKFTLIVAVISLLSRVIGFLREAVIASELGVSFEADAVYVALTLPNIFQFVFGAAVANALTPIFIREKSKALQNGRQLLSSVVIKSCIYFGVIILVILLLSGHVVNLLAPELDDPTKLLAQNIIIYLLPACFLIGISQIFKQLLQAEERLFASNIGQVILNGSVILVMFLSFDHISASVALVYGMFIGSFITILLQLVVLYKVNLNIKLDLRNKHSNEVFKSSIVIMLGLFLNQLYLIINRILASGLSEGSIAALSYSEKIIQLPLGVIAQSLGIVIFPIISELIVDKDERSLNKIVNNSIKIMTIISLPISIVILFFSTEIVDILFGRGAFGDEAIFMTSIALSYFSFMLVSQSLIMVLTRVYYALNKPKVPLYSIFISVTACVILSIWLREILGHGGIALANTIAMAFNSIIMLVCLKRYNINFKLKINSLFMRYTLFLMFFSILNYYLSNKEFLSNTLIDFLLKIFVISFYMILAFFLIKDQDMLNLVEKFKKKLGV